MQEAVRTTPTWGRLWDVGGWGALLGLAALLFGALEGATLPLLAGAGLLTASSCLLLWIKLSLDRYFGEIHSWFEEIEGDTPLSEQPGDAVADANARFARRIEELHPPACLKTDHRQIAAAARELSSALQGCLDARGQAENRMREPAAGYEAARAEFVQTYEWLSRRRAS